MFGAVETVDTQAFYLINRFWQNGFFDVLMPTASIPQNQQAIT